MKSLVNRNGVLNTEYRPKHTKRTSKKISTSTISLVPNDKLKSNDLTVQRLFEHCVELYGEKTAIYFDGKDISYFELNKKANILSNFLIKNGVNKNSIIAVYLESSLEFVVSILAILKAGGAYLPLDITEPSNRTKTILLDSNPVKILTSESIYSSLYPAVASNLEGRVIKVDVFLKENFAEDIINPICLNSPSDLSHVMYTSGSSGVPKGCMISHQSIIRLVKNTNYIEINANDIIAQIANTAFDAMTFELWGALLNGASLYIISHATLLSINDFADLLRDNGISILLITTSMLNLVVKKCPQAFDNLKYLLFGGEKANPEIIKILIRRKKTHHLTHLHIINAYGPTECTTIATSYQINDIKDINESVPIGKPISKTEAYILDETLQAVTSGNIGELYLGGEGLALGYLNDLNQTSSKFIQNPWNNGTKIYKTGDLVYSLPNGDMVFVNRSDEQVKINGFRVELSEVEARIVKRRMVKQAAVVAETTADGRKEIIAYIVFNNGAATDYTKFYQYLKESLPLYMLPRKFYQVDSIPLTKNGKIDKKNLNKLHGINILEIIPKTPPANYLEGLIAEVWQQLLEIPQINTTQNYFDLGAYSLIFNEACTLINEKLKKINKKSINIIDLFTYPTVHLLANYITQQNDLMLNEVVKISSERISFQRHKLVSRKFHHAKN